MKLHEVKQLQPGDEVYWSDPDNDIASRDMTIGSISIKGEVIHIVDTERCYLECFANELS